MDFVIRPMEDRDVLAVLALNAEFVQYLSPLDDAGLTIFREISAYCHVIGVGDQVAGYLIAFTRGAPYDSANFRWFEENTDSFVYIDRIVISADFQGRQFGRAIYDDLRSVAESKGLKNLTCEYNSNPLNVGSQKFHAAYGFAEVGTLWNADQTKQVSLQCYSIL